MVTEMGARVGAGPRGVSVFTVTSPVWIATGATTVPFTGAKGSYVGYASVELDLVQEESTKTMTAKRSMADPV